MSIRTVDPASLGHDLKCLDDLDPNMSEVEGIDCLVQDLFHRWQTPRGWLIDDPDYGRALIMEIGRGFDQAALQALPVSYCNEALKDERVATCVVDILNIVGDSLRMEFAIQSSLGPFRLTASVSQAGLLALEVQN